MLEYWYIKYGLLPLRYLNCQHFPQYASTNNMHARVLSDYVYLALFNQL